MSRADREKSLYIIRLNQIKDELRQSFPDEFQEIEEAQKQNENRKGFLFSMHGLTALEQINEKMGEEFLSQEDDDELDDENQDDGSFQTSISKSEYLN